MHRHPQARLDIDQMMQVMTNLEKNASRSHATGGKLIIGVEGDEEEIRFIISIPGSGYPKNIWIKSSPRFSQPRKWEKNRAWAGTDLRHSKMHKGKIHVDSNDDPSEGPTGTTFTITIPRG